MPILDTEGRIVAILAGCPNDKSWPELSRHAAKLLEQTRVSCNMQEEKHRRGMFSSLRGGVSHGGGQKMPMNLKNRARHQEILADLNGSDSFRRISGFTNSMSPSPPPSSFFTQPNHPRCFHELDAQSSSILCQNPPGLAPQ